MKKLLILAAVIVISLVLLKIFVLTPPGWKADLINPNPTSSPSQAPKQFQFDAATDLEKELDNVNPQVIDSDFNE